MSIPEKILLRKIQKTEKHKLKLIKEKESERKNKDEKDMELTMKRKRDDEVEESSEEDESEVSEEEATDEVHSNGLTGILSDTKFEDLKHLISEKTLRGIADMGFTKLTEIQAQCLEPLLQGKNLVGISKTGSGKTLAYLIHAVESVYKLGFKPRNGTGVIIVAPTRELAMQIFGVLKELMKYHQHTYGLLMGGADRKREAQKLFNGVNILVSTPGRLMDHMQNTEDFVYKNCFALIMDEADRILDIGFEEEMKQIINLLPKNRQRIMFSATQNKKTDALTAFAFKKEPILIKVGDSENTATPSTIDQAYAIVPAEKRFHVLFTFLQKRRNDKVMVFFSSCLSVQFHNDLFNYIDLPVMCIHGDMKRNKRTTTFFKFCNRKTGILLCTDIAARGLDIPAVDWIIQYDPPNDPKEYVHRVGRTARGESGTGKALLFLLPEEKTFLYYLQEANIPLNEMAFKQDKIVDNQGPLEKLVGSNFHLHASAKEAYKSYIRAYESHFLKMSFNVLRLDLQKIALSFGLRSPPAIELKANKQNHQNVKSKFSNAHKNENFKKKFKSK